MKKWPKITQTVQITVGSKRAPALHNFPLFLLILIYFIKNKLVYLVFSEFFSTK